MITERIMESNFFFEKDCRLSFIVKNKTLAANTENNSNNGWKYNGNNGNINANNKFNANSCRPLIEFHNKLNKWLS